MHHIYNAPLYVFSCTVHYAFFIGTLIISLFSGALSSRVLGSSIAAFAFRWGFLWIYIMGSIIHSIRSYSCFFCDAFSFSHAPQSNYSYHVMLILHAAFWFLRCYKETHKEVHYRYDAS